MFNFNVDHCVAISALVLIYFGLMDITLRVPFPERVARTKASAIYFATAVMIFGSEYLSMRVIEYLIPSDMIVTVMLLKVMSAISFPLLFCFVTCKYVKIVDRFAREEFFRQMENK